MDCPTARAQHRRSLHPDLDCAERFNISLFSTSSSLGWHIATLISPVLNDPVRNTTTPITILPNRTGHMTRAATTLTTMLTTEATRMSRFNLHHRIYNAPLLTLPTTKNQMDLERVQPSQGRGRGAPRLNFTVLYKYLTQRIVPRRL